MDDDATLLRRFLREDSQEAFTALVQRYFGLVHAAALRRTNGDAHQARDVAQIVFSSLAREARRFPPGTVLAGWLYVATRNAALNAQRAERRRRNYEQQSHAMNAGVPDGAEFVEWEKLRPLLDTAMDKLSAGDRDVILLRFFERRTYGGVAAALRLSEDAARRRADRALEKLRRVLGQHGITSTASALSLMLTQQAAAVVPGDLAVAVASTAFASTFAAAPSPLVSLISLMNTTKAVTVTALIALLALGGAIYEAKQARQSREALAAMRGERAQLLQRLAASEAKAGTGTEKPTTLASAPTGIAKPRESALPTPSERNAPPPISASALRPGNPLGSLYALRGDAAAMEAWLEAERSGLDLQLGPLFASLGLTPDQIERMKRILMERFESLVDLVGAAQARGWKMSDPEVKASYQAAVEKMENELHALLGDASYEQLKQYGATTSIREIVHALAGDLYYTAAPLTSPQAEQLVQLVSVHSRQNDPTTTDWPKVYADAARFLAPAQVAALRAEQEQMALRDHLDRIGRTVGR